MSSYVVGDDTINRALALWHHNQYGQWSGLAVENWDDLGLRMLQLNCRAVNHRYPDHEPSTAEAFKSDVRFDTSRIQAYKSLQCLLYQCNEGELDRTELYREMKQKLDLVAHEIVESLPEYDAADWG